MDISNPLIVLMGWFGALLFGIAIGQAMERGKKLIDHKYCANAYCPICHPGVGTGKGDGHL